MVLAGNKYLCLTTGSDGTVLKDHVQRMMIAMDVKAKKWENHKRHVMLNFTAI